MKLHLFIAWMSVFLLVGGMYEPPRPAKAFEPKADYWFSETLTLAVVNLPAGITIHVSDPSISPRGWLLVENRNENPLYVMPLKYKDLLVMVTPDPGWETRITLAHEAAAYLVAPERPAALTIEALADLDHSLVDRNVLSHDTPPADLTIPEAQKSELLLVFGGQVLEAPFTISYSINASFDNGSAFIFSVMENIQATDSARATSTQLAIANTARPGGNSLALSLAALAAALVLGWLAWKSLLHRNRPH